ncbi:polysaccharide biosynthesis/export family protein [Pseudobacteriovorax antillogorgiicola]|uniref:Polysaccharide export outer membrane protein n=1 Tax=Pseudobacteriovorax antillogorgiicola TaxID=1513793 RepID=A0A1Y6BIE9_9BACT|nr:polysaccharide biosynthesis/export family protein [Pseudobacteriovorax antillogorgiicola]TCS55387.1 polysaccharide export outer membrane protein [Pseudobacteriovorax antillogorgiicola]SMF13174.1 polysaccharide export outer membrane protein [Pseudobacteriovorax antillogorgiicola]
MIYGTKLGFLIWIILISSCSHYIDAEPLKNIQSGRTFDRQGTYRISPGDQVNVLVYGEDKLSGVFTISSTGFLSVPLIPPLQVSGLTTQQLNRKLGNALRSLIKSPRVSTSLTGAKNFQVYFTGEVNTVGAVNLTNETTLLQAISLAGGLNEFASGRIVLVRKIASKQVKRYATSYEDILSGSLQLDHLSLEAGDVIIAE